MTARDRLRRRAREARAMVERQGGDPRVVDDYDGLPAAPSARRAARRSMATSRRCDAGLIGRASMALGAGRDSVEDTIDHGVGLLIAAARATRSARASRAASCSTGPSAARRRAAAVERAVQAGASREAARSADHRRGATAAPCGLTDTSAIGADLGGSWRQCSRVCWLCACLALLAAAAAGQTRRRRSVANVASASSSTSAARTTARSTPRPGPA